MMNTLGKYRILREIGKGATATVYLAQDPARPDENLAIKHISFNSNDQDGGQWSRRLKKLLRTEWTVLAGLNHPNIIRVLDAVITEEEAYLVMEYVEGSSLEGYCSFERLLPMSRAIGIVFKCALALDYAYQHGIVHRDIKPANILLGPDDNVKIMDFGLALNTQKHSDQDSTFIMGVGSPSYMSPEQIKGYPLSQKTDLYSLGVVLYHLLTGRTPFRAKTPAQLIYKIINADPPKPSRLNPALPPQVDAILSRALEKDTYSRYTSGAELAKDLSAVRYRVLDDNRSKLDDARFKAMRALPFFDEFEDVELWEVLRMAQWKEAPEHSLLQQEGIAENRIRIILSGQVEASLNGKQLLVLNPADPLGELMYLDELHDANHIQSSFTAVTLSRTNYLEFNPAALALATEECLEKFRRRLIAHVVRRLADAMQRLALQGASATPPVDKLAGITLSLTEEHHDISSQPDTPPASAFSLELVPIHPA